MPFKEFEQRFAPLLVEPGGDATSMLAKMGSSLARLITKPEERGESEQAAAAAEEAVARGTARCLIILRRAALHEHRHYAFGKTLVFLRNGVEGALIQAVQKQMVSLAVSQTTAGGPSHLDISPMCHAAAGAHSPCLRPCATARGDVVPKGGAPTLRNAPVRILEGGYRQ